MEQHQGTREACRAEAPAPSPRADATRQRQDEGEGTGPTPPLLIGGVIYPKTERIEDRAQTNTGIDWLTVTMPPRVSLHLQELTRFDEPGRPTQGFSRSEKRHAIGGWCFRKMDPYAESKRWGLLYENWEFPGGSSSYYANELLGQPVKVPRIDLAFDYVVPSHFMPKDLEPAFIEYVKSRGMEPRYAGPSSSYTVYLGSSSSERMIRIYRRDLKNGALFEDDLHILRVELQLKGDMAQAYWDHAAANGEHDFSVAAQHIRDMTGLLPIKQGEVDLPKLVQPIDDQDGIQAVFQFIKQNHGMIVACRQAGIDINHLAEAALERPTPVQKSRLARRVQLLKSMEAFDIEMAVKWLLNPDPASVPVPA